MDDSTLQAAEARLKAAELQLREAQARGSAPGRTAQDIDLWHQAAAEHGRAVVAYKEAQVDAKLRGTQPSTAAQESQQSRGRIIGRL
jgi:hypothetical protein